MSDSWFLPLNAATAQQREIRSALVQASQHRPSTWDQPDWTSVSFLNRSDREEVSCDPSTAFQERVLLGQLDESLIRASTVRSTDDRHSYTPVTATIKRVTRTGTIIAAMCTGWQDLSRDEKRRSEARMNDGRVRLCRIRRWTSEGEVFVVGNKVDMTEFSVRVWR